VKLFIYYFIFMHDVIWMWGLVQNLTYARDICDIMKIDKTGAIIPTEDAASVPSFGAAADGDADRNVGSHSSLPCSVLRLACW
jgi:hypothetical protein